MCAEQRNTTLSMYRLVVIGTIKGSEGEIILKHSCEIGR